jgi:hypothetical protein
MAEFIGLCVTNSDLTRSIAELLNKIGGRREDRTRGLALSASCA